MKSEMAHTLPTDFCPHPEHYHSENCSATEREVSEFIAGLVRLTQPEIVVETGTCLGHTAYQIGKALSANGHGQLYTLETDAEFCGKAQRRCLALPVQVINLPAMAWTPPGKIDFLFIDSADDRWEEFLHYRPHLSPRAIIVLHDTREGYHGADAARRILDQEEILEHIVFNNPRGLLVAKLMEEGN